MKAIKIVLVALIVFNIQSCKDDINLEELEVPVNNFASEETELFEFGYNLNNFRVIRDTIRNGDTFGVILERNNLGFSKIYNIAEVAKDTFDVTRRLQVGKPYTLLCSKDDTKEPQAFIYQPNKENYVVIEFCDSILAYRKKKPSKLVEKIATGIIQNNSNISEVLDNQGLSVQLAYKMADDIYAWTIDFNRLQAGDRFKVVYTDKFIDDSIYVGVHNIKAAYFEHKKEPFYAFEFETDSTKGIIDYFSEEAKNLRRAFLKAPVKFSRISSKYNLRRRIAHYGYRVKAHRGTDFAAANGTPIMATANGTVTKSAYARGNGNYVKIRHNATYETQYLHMSRRASKVGDFVKQGDIIGYVGNTGSSAGNHVCYRFWKNGKQVDPFKEKLPEAKPISDSLKIKFLEFIKPTKMQLDNIDYIKPSPIVIEPREELKPAQH